MIVVVVVVQSLSCVRPFATPWPAAHEASLCFTISQSLLKLTSIELVMPSRPLFSPSPAAFSLSQHQGFSSELALHIMWPKYWSFSFSMSPSIEYSGLISFRIDWFDLAAQETLRSLLQHHSSKASILQLCFLYGPTLTSIHDYWKNHSFY